MKVRERGPFSSVQWFCKDGTIQPPVSLACRDHGGGSQHGQWSERTQLLRDQGYLIANFLSPLDYTTLPDEPGFHDFFGQAQVEKFLVGIDDGWILRRAMFYRGAFQEEGEREGAERLLKALAGRDYWLQGGFPMLRTGAKVLPHGSETQSIAIVRQDSANLSDRDPAFKPLRAKIHGAPDAGDADRVRAFANTQAPAELKQEYARLADEIDRVYATTPLAETLRDRAQAYDRGPWLQELLRTSADSLDASNSPVSRFRATGRLMADLRMALPRIQSAMVRLQVIDLGLRAEQEHFRAAAELRPNLHEFTRQELLELAFAAADASFGAGLLNSRLYQEITYQQNVLDQPDLALGDYLNLLAVLSRAPGWGMAALRMHFQDAMDKLSELEPVGQLFIQEQLRSSPLLFYSDLLDLLLQDSGQLAGIRQQLFGQEIGLGMTALNPGLARGVLHARSEPMALEDFEAGGIYLLPETIAELPPVAGILTAGEGNPLSHIQLLARNLGIPNVVIASSVIPLVTAHDGKDSVLAVSPGGVVELAPFGPRWEAYFATGSSQDIVIRPDLGKLDLAQREPVSLDELRENDSGRTVGPKAAKLGELKSVYPDSVARGVALPFGIFYAEALARPWPGDTSGKTTIFDWMQQQYRRIADLADDSVEQVRFTEAFREDLYDLIATTPISPELRQALASELRRVFGDGPLPGMFIRSDTNVEDLPGFTGAGLNLTLPNVVGFENLLAGIPKVWASPFTARAFAWRQALMTQPEHVYTSILLLESVPVEKSGVLVTRDIDSGNPDVLSVAVNEGPGGAVDGQAAESLRIPMDGSRVRVLATATAPTRRVLSPEGGVNAVPASGSDEVLEEHEIAQLIEFARVLPQRFPALVDANGQPAPADVEFGFLDGRLRLFQIRPFLDNAAARGSDYLRRLDETLATHRDRRVVLEEIPGQ